MKRSHKVTLVLMGTTALGLSACDLAPEAYANVDACIAAKRHTEAECRDGFAAAQREREQTGQHFLNREECVTRYGSDGCEPYTSPTGTTFFMPLMVGFMLGHAGFHPLYRDPNRQDQYVSSTGTAFHGYSGGGGWFSRGLSSFGREVGSITRGGFGSIGRSLSVGS